MSIYIQDLQAEKTVLVDWADNLARAEKDLGLAAGTLTIASATITPPSGVTAASVTVDDAFTGVLFVLSSTLTEAADVTLTVRVTLSNGDVDEEDVLVGLR